MTPLKHNQTCCSVTETQKRERERASGFVPNKEKAQLNSSSRELNNLETLNFLTNYIGSHIGLHDSLIISMEMILLEGMDEDPKIDT